MSYDSCPLRILSYQKKGVALSTKISQDHHVRSDQNINMAGQTAWLTWLNFDCTFNSLHCRLVSSLPLRMTDQAVKRVVSDIIRSPEDKRVYRGLEFTNGLKAMLISDPTTDKSSAALDVQIGKGLSSLLPCQVVMCFHLAFLTGTLWKAVG